REVLADLHARHIGANGAERAADIVGSVRLEVPGVKVAWGANEEEEDAVDVAAAAVGAGLRLAEQVGQAEAKCSAGQGANAQKVAPCQAVAELDATFRLEGQHALFLPIPGAAGDARADPQVHIILSAGSVGAIEMLLHRVATCHPRAYNSADTLLIAK